MPQSPPPAPESWRQRAEALHQEFVVAFVEGQDFCPWAHSARVAGRTKVVALRWHEVARFMCDILPLEENRKMEVWQLVVPDANERAMPWRRDVAELELRLRKDGIDLPWALAAFHPTHPGRQGTPGGTIGMLRRSPLPAIQLVRLDVLDRVRERAAKQVEALPAHNRVQLQYWLEEPEQQQRHEAWLQQGAAIAQAVRAMSTPSTL